MARWGMGMPSLYISYELFKREACGVQNEHCWQVGNPPPAYQSTPSVIAPARRMLPLQWLGTVDEAPILGGGSPWRQLEQLCRRPALARLLSAISKAEHWAIGLDRI